MEIFGLYITESNNTKQAAYGLLAEALTYCFDNYQDIDKVDYFIDDEEENQMQAAEEIGFEYYNSYRCFKIELQ